MRRATEKKVEAIATQTHHTLLGMLRAQNLQLMALCRQLAEGGKWARDMIDIYIGISEFSDAANEKYRKLESALQAAKRAKVIDDK